MHLTLALLAAALPAQAAAPPNLAFSSGRLTHWEGEGFYPTTATGNGPSVCWGVCSSDRGEHGRTGLLHRTFIVPPGAGAIRFTAAAVRPRGCDPGPTLDVVLEAAERRIVPKLVRTPLGPQSAATLLPAQRGRPQEYHWPVADLAGQRVRIALIDRDDRPGCHVFCSGFRVVPRDDYLGREFADHMVRLAREHQLAPMTRYDSKHFLALGNADDDFIEERLYNCETIHDLFFEHFRRKGFPVRRPPGRMMVAILDSQAGFEAYLGRTMPSAVTGVYHLPSNRLVVYDYGTNRAFVANRKRGEELARQIPATIERQRVVTTLGRHAQDRRADANVGTIVHEVAHQLSFNGGLLRRDGDVPLWLAEGLACYCEATDGGAWRGVGEPNPQRAQSLAGPARGRGEFIPLQTLISSDDWLRQPTRAEQAVLGYAQSWALFRMLMEERPQALRKYLALIADRRMPDHRLTDFGEAFGADLAKLEARYLAYLKETVQQQVRPEK
jgi:hypothetical protein